MIEDQYLAPVPEGGIGGPVFAIAGGNVGRCGGNGPFRDCDDGTTEGTTGGRTDDPDEPSCKCVGGSCFKSIGVVGVVGVNIVVGEFDWKLTTSKNDEKYSSSKINLKKIQKVLPGSFTPVLFNLFTLV